MLPQHYQATPESIARAKASAQREREDVLRYHQLRDDDKRGLSRMVDVHGSTQVRIWLDSLAAIEADLRRG